MRITNSMMISNVLRDLNGGLGRTNTYYSQLASNRKMVKLSDNPVGLVNSLNARQEMRQLSQYRDNITTTRKWVQQAETSITDMQSIIVKIKENVVDAGGTKNSTDRKNIAALVSELKEHLYETANTAIGDKFIFGGFNSTKKPFTKDENGKVLYNGINLADTEPKPVGTNSFNFTEGGNMVKDSFKLTGVTNPPEQYTIERTDTHTIKVTNSAGVTKSIDLTNAKIKQSPVFDKNGDPTGVYKNELDIDYNDLKVGTLTWESRVTDVALGDAGGKLNSLQWNGPITAEGSYNIGVGTSADHIIITDDSTPAKTVVDVKIDASSGELDLTEYGLGTIKWSNNGASGEEIADAIANGAIGNKIDTDNAKTALDALMTGATGGKLTVTSNLFNQMSIPKFKNKPVNFTWGGPIRASNKYYVEVDSRDPNSITIKNAQGEFITTQNLDGAKSPLDLTQFGLGTISWPDGTPAPTPQDIANVGYMTTELGEESSQKIQFEIGYQIKMDATFTGIDIMGTGEQNLFKVLDDLIADLEDPNSSNDDLTVYHTRLTKVQDKLLTCAVELGARTQKLDTMENRYSLDNINMEARRTDIEDIDQAETIMKMKFAEAIYKQALATGAMIIQPTLMDFLN